MLLTGGRYDYPKVVAALAEKGIDESRVILDLSMCVQGFTREKYQALCAARLSVFATNCSGSLISHQFCLPFLTPFVNTWVDPTDFLTMLERNPQYALQGTLRFKGTMFNDNKGEHFIYPVYDLNGMAVQMVHYRDFAQAKAKWYERVQRVNWYNLLILTYSNDLAFLARFDKLPFAKKICFTPLQTDYPSAWQIPPEIYARWRDSEGRQFEEPDKMDSIMMDIAKGRLRVYDLWDMLLYGKKTLLTEE